MKALLLFLHLFAGSAFAQDSIRFVRQDISVPVALAEALKRAQMTFEMPEGFITTAIIPNEDMDYLYAVRLPDKKLEVRYVIWPLDSQLARYSLPRKEGETIIDPNTICQKVTLMHMANISETPIDELQDILPFDSAAVRNEFNADWGGTAVVKLRKSFGQKYKWCSVVALHKDKVADAWYFYLSKDKDDISNLMMPAFHSLKFK